LLISKEFTFDAAHRLMKYKGKCENLHGHTYKLRENLARWIWEQLFNPLRSSSYSLYEVIVWESTSSFVTYRGEYFEGCSE